MKVKDITITSKNQITLPKIFVNQLQIGKGRQLKAKIQGNSIILTPEDSLTSVMQGYWGKRQPKAHLTNQQLNDAVRKSAINRTKK